MSNCLDSITSLSQQFENGSSFLQSMNASLATHFYTLTTSFFNPLSHYIQSFILPPPKSFIPFFFRPQPRPFSKSQFLSLFKSNFWPSFKSQIVHSLSIQQGPSARSSRSSGLSFSIPRSWHTVSLWQGLYSDFFASRNFEHWFSRQHQQILASIHSQYREACLECNIAKLIYLKTADWKQRLSEQDISTFTVVNIAPHLAQLSHGSNSQFLPSGIPRATLVPCHVLVDIYSHIKLFLISELDRFGFSFSRPSSRACSTTTLETESLFPSDIQSAIHFNSNSQTSTSSINSNLHLQSGHTFSSSSSSSSSSLHTCDLKTLYSRYPHLEKITDQMRLLGSLLPPPYDEIPRHEQLFQLDTMLENCS